MPMVTLSFWLLRVLMMTGSASVCLLLARDLNLTMRELTSSCPSVVSIDKSVTRFDNRVIIILFPTAVETHCQKPNRGLPGIRPCDDRYLLRDNNQQQPHKISYAHDCCGSIRYNSRYQLCCRGSFAINLLATTVAVPPRIILVHSCVAMASWRPRQVLLTPAVVMSLMIAAQKVAVLETSLPGLRAVSQVDVVGKCLEKKTTRLLRMHMKWKA